MKMYQKIKSIYQQDKKILLALCVFSIVVCCSCNKYANACMG